MVNFAGEVIVRNNVDELFVGAVPGGGDMAVSGGKTLGTRLKFMSFHDAWSYEINTGGYLGGWLEKQVRLGNNESELLHPGT